MATIRYSMRQKKWIVTWKVRGATFHHECASEESALSFSEIQRTISQKREGTVHANQAHPQKHHHPGTVRSPLQPVLKTSDNNQAGSLSRQTSAPIPRNQASSVHNSKKKFWLFANPRKHLVWPNPRSTGGFLCCVQSQVGEKEKGIYLQPLRIAPFQKGKPEELPRRPSRNSMHSCASLSRMSSASSYSAFIRVPASARVNSFP